MTRIIVYDTGPLLHLSEAATSHRLSLAGEISIPPLVAIEFEANAQGWNPVLATWSSAKFSESQGRTCANFR